MTPPGAGARVLLVDDDDDVRFVIGVALRRSGYVTVHAAESGAAALAYLRAAEVLPDVVLMDVSMPDMSGPDALAELQADPALAAVPVIFVTGQVRGPEIAALRESGAAGVIVKPFDPASLDAQIQACLR